MAIVIFNLGGPDKPEAIQPFLFNLFNDPAILMIPNPFRWILAKIISILRAPESKKIYAKVGGKSTLLPETLSQARAIKKNLSETKRRIFIHESLILSFTFFLKFLYKIINNLP